MSSMSRAVFVGNIPYDATEQQLVDMFSTVGPVVTFRLVHDRDTGKPRGYGFCEFNDSDTAQSAIRNLNNADFHGRALRVDYAEDDQKMRDGMGDTFMSAAPSTASSAPVLTPAALQLQQANLARAQTEALIALAEKKSLPTNSTASAASAAAANDAFHAPKELDAAKRKAARRVPSIIGSQVVPNKQITHSVEIISKLVQGLTRPQQIEILSEMKKFIAATPDAARQLLTDNPQISQTVLQILVLYGLVRPADIQSLHVNKAAEDGSAAGSGGGGGGNNGRGSGSGGGGGGASNSELIEKQRIALLQAQREAQAAELLRQQQVLQAEVLRQAAIQQQQQNMLQQQQLMQQQAMMQAAAAQQHAMMQAATQQQQQQQITAQQQSMPSLLQAQNSSQPNPVTAGTAAPPGAAGVGGGGAAPAAAGAPLQHVTAQLPPAQQQILREVLKLSPDQIKLLPPQVQAQVYQLQQQLAMRR